MPMSSNSANSRVALKLTVNGAPVEVEAEARELLVTVLRDRLNLTGTHIGCDTTNCGCCSVLLDGRVVKSCTVLAGQADGCDVTTIEGVAKPGGELNDIQEAFVEEHALQCGYCTPGMVMCAIDLLRRELNPSDEQIRDALAGNLCRCTGYQPIVRAIAKVAAARRADVTLQGQS